MAVTLPPLSAPEFEAQPESHEDPPSLLLKTSFAPT
jgi:hypothetical protein